MGKGGPFHHWMGRVTCLTPHGRTGSTAGGIHVRSELVLKCNFNIHQLIRKFRLMQTFFLTYHHPPSFLLQKKLYSRNRICCCLSLSVSRGRYWVNPGL